MNVDKDSLFLLKEDELSKVKLKNYSRGELENKFRDLLIQLKRAYHKIDDLETKGALNSQNSSNPPSTDQFDKPQPKSERKKSGKTSGGQTGHKGETKPLESKPDVIEILEVTTCSCCNGSLAESPIEYDIRQVIDIPVLRAQVTEYLREKKTCVTCGTANFGKFPDNVTAPVQYGANLQSLLVYINQYQMIPYQRTQEFIADICNINISQGTIFNIVNSCYDSLQNFELQVKESLINTEQVHFDETGININGRNFWCHSASTNKLTHYHIDEKRGIVGMEAAGILPNFVGIATHDHWSSYFHYDCYHSLCNAHHVRELTFVAEVFKQQWAQDMKEFLYRANDVVVDAKALGDRQLKLEVLTSLVEEYDDILKKGLQEIPQIINEGKKGRKKQHKSKNLHDRLCAYKKETLGFLYDFRVPFTNNLAERDIRMNKVKQKISGSYRSQHGSKIFSRLRSFFSTIRKNHKGIMEHISSAVSGNADLSTILNSS